MSKNIQLKKGFDIKLVGQAQPSVATIEQPETFAVKPTDFAGFQRPKVLVKEGDTVKAGDVLFFDRKQEDVMYTAPVSGEVVEIKRGAQRKLLEVIILADKQIEYKQFSVPSIADLSLEQAKATMLESGVWPQIVQRPFAVVANSEVTPRAVFISGFDSHPLAPDFEFLYKGQEKYLQAGIDVLKKFTSDVHVNINSAASSSIFANLNGVTVNKVSGPHPAGNVGVQIHHIAPIAGAEDVVWTLNPTGLAQIGKLFTEGIYDTKKLVAIAGSEVESPEYVETYGGARLNKVVAAKVKNSHVRIISGNVLTGESVGKDGYLGYYDQLVTVLPEGDKPRFFLTDGWLGFITDRLSFHRAFGLLGGKNKTYKLDTSLNGEERAFVMTGAFEKVLPMDIYPTYLLKAIMAGDYEEMEALGIYEVAEEDLALCEFIDVSKHDVQAMIREGIEMLRLS
ncbi:Na(+)-translocating NADH-quinone reductase subunit A [Limibacter armeniacum]|uniref:Na(+)-translocating NADH-quinone reductase subunit A n=1 Tax=Limibacter armeniacum TaxID=466084 RepID=UPI002FE68FBE